MAQWVYVNGAFKPYHQASIHIEDRGFLFGDGVYEALAIRDGHIIDLGAHLDRLDYSLSQIQINNAISPKALPFVMREIVKRNRVRDGFLYMQITRGVSPRAHVFPENSTPSLMILAGTLPAKKTALEALNIITMAEQRWQRCDIKSINLLPNLLAKQKAFEAGADETWFINEEGYITEGASSNAWIYRQGRLLTYSADKNILNGITRKHIFAIARDEQIAIDEKGFTLDEALSSDEAFISSSIGGICRVQSINGQNIKSGGLSYQLNQSLYRNQQNQAQQNC